MWIMRKITEAQLQTAVTKGYLSQEEADAIKVIQQVPQV